MMELRKATAVERSRCADFEDFPTGNKSGRQAAFFVRADSSSQSHVPLVIAFPGLRIAVAFGATAGLFVASHLAVVGSPIFR